MNTPTPPTLNSLSSAAAARKIPQLVAVASGKGGVGKTWFSVSLAQALAQLSQKVLLVDGDLGLANVDIQLGLMPPQDITDIIAGRATSEEVIQHFESGGFDVLPGRSGSSSLASLPTARLEILHKLLARQAARYDRVLLDLGAGIDQTVQTLGHWASAHIVVTTAEPTALTDAYAYIKTFYRAEATANLYVVVNQAETVAEGKKTYEILQGACENFLQKSPPLLGVLRRDARVVDAIRHQSPFLSRYPTSELAQEVRTIARQLPKVAKGAAA